MRELGSAASREEVIARLAHHFVRHFGFDDFVVNEMGRDHPDGLGVILTETYL
jgi:hypothetical protein